MIKGPRQHVQELSVPVSVDERLKDCVLSRQDHYSESRQEAMLPRRHTARPDRHIPDSSSERG